MGERRGKSRFHSQFPISILFELIASFHFCWAFSPSQPTTKIKFKKKQTLQGIQDPTTRARVCSNHEFAGSTSPKFKSKKWMQCSLAQPQPAHWVEYPDMSWYLAFNKDTCSFDAQKPALPWLNPLYSENWWCSRVSWSQLDALKSETEDMFRYQRWGEEHPPLNTVAVRISGPGQSTKET